MDHRGGRGGRDRSRSRSRSRSPDRGRDLQERSKKEKQEEDRRARMARLRAENEAEEKRLASAETSADGGSGTAIGGGTSAQHDGAGSSAADEIVEVNDTALEGLDEEEQMRMLLGFSGGFGSTSGKAVEDNKKSAAKGAANKTKARKYRQYMNRKGGFNRPLDKMP